MEKLRRLAGCVLTIPRTRCNPTTRFYRRLHLNFSRRAQSHVVNKGWHLRVNPWVLWVRVHVRRGQLPLFLKHQMRAQCINFILNAEGAQVAEFRVGHVELFLRARELVNFELHVGSPLQAAVPGVVLVEITFSAAPINSGAQPDVVAHRQFFGGFHAAVGFVPDQICAAIVSVPVLTKVIYRTLGRRLRKILKNTRRFKKIVRYLTPRRRLIYVCRLSRFLLRASQHATLGERILKLVEVDTHNGGAMSRLAGVCQRQQMGNISELFSRRPR
jgi:hypothetical protein